MNKQAEEFIRDATIKLLKGGIGINLKKSMRVDDCNGFFCSETKQLAVAIGKPQKLWFPIFVHEYCHFEQWTEGCEIWEKSMDDSLPNIWEWLEGDEEFPAKDLKKAFYLTQLLEQDCDKRVAEKIEEFDLPIDRDRYIQTANAYHLFYQVALQERVWYLDAPYQVEKIVETMPTKWLSKRDLKTTNHEFIDVVMSNCRVKQKESHGE
jgi:hypothetical protein